MEHDSLLFNFNNKSYFLNLSDSAILNSLDNHFDTINLNKNKFLIETVSREIINIDRLVQENLLPRESPDDDLAAIYLIKILGLIDFTNFISLKSTTDESGQYFKKDIQNKDKLIEILYHLMKKEKSGVISIFSKGVKLGPEFFNFL